MDSIADRLTRIDTEITEHRRLWQRAVWAGETLAADYHRSEWDRLLSLRLRVTNGPLAAT